jgi:glycosyltransferase involved in cell wall biosynthesis
VASLNGVEWLPRLYADIAACDPQRVELVVADGGSRDGTMAWLETVAERTDAIRLAWLSAADSGVAQAWNRGLGLVAGRWVLFLGADDRVPDPRLLETLVGRAEALEPSVDFAALPVAVVSPQGQPIGEARPRLGPDGNLLFALNTVPHQGLLHRADVWSRFGDFDETFRLAADYEFLVRAIRAGATLRVLDDPPVTHMTFGGISKHDPLATIMEIRRAQRKLGIRWPAAAWWWAWSRAFARAAVLPVLGSTATARLADLFRRLRGLQPAWTVS